MKKVAHFTIIGIALGALILARGFGGELLPEFREGHFVAVLSLNPGSSLEETVRVGKVVSEQMLALDRIATVEQQVGRAETGEDTWGPPNIEFHIDQKRGTTPEFEIETQEGLRDLLVTNGKSPTSSRNSTTVSGRSRAIPSSGLHRG